MDELIKKYKNRLRDLRREFKEHRERDAIATYIYGKILTYERVINDLLILKGEEPNNNIGVFR